MGLSIANDLTVDVNRRALTHGAAKAAEVGHKIVLEQESVSGCVLNKAGTSDDLSQGVDGVSVAPIAAERTQIGHDTILDDDGVFGLVVIRGIRNKNPGIPNNLAAIVDADGLAGTAAEGAQIGHDAVLTNEGVRDKIAGQRSAADDLSEGIEPVGFAICAAECTKMGFEAQWNGRSS